MKTLKYKIVDLASAWHQNGYGEAPIALLLVSFFKGPLLSILSNMLCNFLSCAMAPFGYGGVQQSVLPRMDHGLEDLAVLSKPKYM